MPNELQDWAKIRKLVAQQRELSEQYFEKLVNSGYRNKGSYSLEFVGKLVNFSSIEQERIYNIIIRDQAS